MSQDKPQWVGLGSAIARVTRVMGIEPCEGCRRRQQALDRLVPRVWKSRSARPKKALTSKRPPWARQR